MSKPRITCCILTRDSGKTLRATLESIAKQSLPKEIIIVDTMSSDDTLKIADDYNTIVAKDSTNNLAMARNTALKKAKGRYIAFIDSDAILYDNWDKRMLAYLREDNVAGVCSNWKSFGNSPIERAQDTLRKRQGVIDTQSIPTMNALYDREKIANTTFNPVFARGGEDLDFNFQLRAKGYRLLMDTTKHVIHHNPNTLSALLSKSYNYGKWYLMAHKNHKQEQTLQFNLRFCYSIALAFNALFSLLFPPWALLLLLQLLLPMLAYLRMTLDFNASLYNMLKFNAHSLGILRGLI